MSEIRFGNYRISETLGSGGLSTIYKAVQEPLGRVVAVKALKTQIAPTSSFGEQLDRESKLLSDLAHPNIVLLLDAGRSASGRPYLVLEHVDGPSLQKLLAKKKRLEAPAALAIAIGICSALEHAHERGVVHRDVKPSNVLISKLGNVKMIDFGIAQRARTASVSDALGTEGITASGRIAPETLKDAFGTPAYMSPEQILGDFVDGRSDLFSLGVVLYEMLSGTRPFDVVDPASPGDARLRRNVDVVDPASPGDARLRRNVDVVDSASPGDARLRRNVDVVDSASRSSVPPSSHGPAASAQRIRRDAPAALRDRAPAVPRNVERLVMRLLEKSPAERYVNAAAVKERLEGALRAITRDDPALLVKRALAEAGFIAMPRPNANDHALEGLEGLEGVSRTSSAPPSRVRRAILGQAAVLALFLGAIAFVEAPSCAGGSTSSRNTSDKLVLAPENAGGLRVVATPWAYVKVDGEQVETTPFARAIPLSAGHHWVTLVHPDAPPIEREVVVAPGEIVALDVTMAIGADDAGKDAR